MDFGAFKFESENIVMPETNTHLHVILPAKDINVLNPSQKNKHHKNYNSENSEVYIEIGCKIDSVEYLVRSKNE